MTIANVNHLLPPSGVRRPFALRLVKPSNPAGPRLTGNIAGEASGNKIT